MITGDPGVLLWPTNKDRNKHYFEHINSVKNPNWPDANQLAVYKHDRAVELGTTEEKSSYRVA